MYHTYVDLNLSKILWIDSLYTNKNFSQKLSYMETRNKMFKFNNLKE